MSIEGRPDAAEILAALQRGKIPPELGPDWAALKRLTNSAWLVVFVCFTIVFFLPLFVLGLLNFRRWGSIDVLLVNCMLILVLGAPLAISAFVNFRRRRIIRADLSAGQIQQAEGEILWHGSNYQPRFVGQRKWSTYLYNYGGSRPGPYRFYFLPRSGAVLLIELLSCENQTSALIGPLRQALGFQMGDLDYNRRVQMSPRQRRLVVAHSFGRLLFALLLLAIMVTSVAFNWPKVVASAAAVRTVLALVLLGVPFSIALVYLCRHAWISEGTRPMAGSRYRRGSPSYIRLLAPSSGYASTYKGSS